MSDHGWGGDWPDDLDPDSSGDLGGDTSDPGADYGAGLGAEYGPDPGSDFGSDFGEAETADLGAFDHHPDPDPTADAPLDPAGDSTVDGGPGDGPFDGADGGDTDPGDGDAPEPTPVGADPDVDAHADTWTDQAFPEPLDVDAPEPVDGFPWTDPATLGAAPLPDPDAGYQGAPEANELAAYAGEELPPGTDPWTALAASEDPATSSLARWWAPDT
ncbi:hypothetical protein RB614_16805 [Phytohabitans sp. ZYX-F-186]|uniref:Uncharacterized protein n=1 Tax=Phytohabitans maris TaxID=3071409 RepID=A0ABU0ZGP9_9ACTN|nr:hypothetical protein [Phytohabitans sp. ZYX-F-186]MDQ7906173.1 hypothetical protein [Phytohabitans sp. ZYX-F-186]